MGLSCMELFVLLILVWLLPSHVVKFSTMIFSNIFSGPFLFSPSSVTLPTYNSNAEMFHVVSWVCETVLFSFHSFFSFFLSYSRDFSHFVSQVTYLFFCLSHSFCYWFLLVHSSFQLLSCSSVCSLVCLDFCLTFHVSSWSVPPSFSQALWSPLLSLLWITFR